MGLFSRKPTVIPEEFNTFNTFPPEKEKLLCVGAASTECKHKIETKLSGSNKALKLYYPKKRGAKLIKYWLPMFGIQNPLSAYNVISDWINTNDYSSVVLSDTKFKVQKEITKAAQKVGTNPEELLAMTEKVQNYGAFDLDRLGYIVRVCFSLDYLTEEQAWTFMEKLWEEANAHFSSWDEYIISFKNGEEGLGTSWYSDAILSYVELKNDSNSIINRYPLG